MAEKKKDITNQQAVATTYGRRESKKAVEQRPSNQEHPVGDETPPRVVIPRQIRTPRMPFAGHASHVRIYSSLPLLLKYWGDGSDDSSAGASAGGKHGLDASTPVSFRALVEGDRDQQATSTRSSHPKDRGDGSSDSSTGASAGGKHGLDASIPISFRAVMAGVSDQQDTSTQSSLVSTGGDLDRMKAVTPESSSPASNGENHDDVGLSERYLHYIRVEFPAQLRKIMEQQERQLKSAASKRSKRQRDA